MRKQTTHSLPVLLVFALPAVLAWFWPWAWFIALVWSLFLLVRPRLAWACTVFEHEWRLDVQWEPQWRLERRCAACGRRERFRAAPAPQEMHLHALVQASRAQASRWQLIDPWADPNVG
jgi:hypothetical protein